MLIAKTQDHKVLQVSDYRNIFPNTSFTAAGPDVTFLEENSCLPVVNPACDPTTHKLVVIDPVIVKDHVETYAVQELTASEASVHYEAALDQHLDAVARKYRYNDRFTFALRAGYDGPFQAEGVAFAQWMDSCNIRAYQLLQEVQSGVTQAPSISAFVELLPEFVKP